MRILLDECVPAELARELPGHDVLTVAGCGWAALPDAALLHVAATRFDALITVDRGYAHRRRLPPGRIGVVVLLTRTNDIADIQPHVRRLARVLRALRPGRIVVIEP